ncbi:MAG: preprotein translocase subunit SecA, partial [Methylophilus methylotrophus]
QGDPGSSRFYLSLEDPLLRIFSGERVAAIMTRLNMPEGEAIEHAMVTRAIENAQRKVEGRNFDIRKQLLEYDDVSNDQRKVIYEQRNELLESVDVGQTIRAMREDVINSLFNTYVPPGSVEEQWEIPALEQALQAELSISLPVAEWLENNPDLHEETLRERILNAANESYAEKEAMAGNDNMRNFERAVMLQSLDNHWREHLAALDHLRQGIHLRSYAQKNPKQEYKREAFELFESLLNTVKSEVTKITMQVQVRSREELEEEERRAEEAMRAAEVGNLQYQHTDYNTDSAASSPNLPEGVRVGRNDPCPCGSGKRYKNCHGALS